MRVAVVDIGSNSIKLLVAARAPGGPLVEVATRTLDVRISGGIGSERPPPRRHAKGQGGGPAPPAAPLRPTSGWGGGSARIGPVSADRRWNRGLPRSRASCPRPGGWAPT